MKTYSDLIASARPIKTAAMADKWWKTNIRRLTTSENAALGLPATKNRAEEILKFQVEVITPRLSQRTVACLTSRAEKSRLAKSL